MEDGEECYEERRLVGVWKGLGGSGGGWFRCNRVVRDDYGVGVGFGVEIVASID